MNLRLVQFSLGPGKRSEAKAIADKIVPSIRSQPGCERAEFFADYDAGDYGLVVLWKSKEQANAAATVIGPMMTAALAQAKGTGDSRRLFEVYDPKS